MGETYFQIESLDIGKYSSIENWLGKALTVAFLYVSEHLPDPHTANVYQMFRDFPVFQSAKEDSEHSGW